MKASIIRKSLLSTAIAASLLGASAFAADPVVSTIGGLSGYDVIKAPASIDKL